MDRRLEEAFVRVWIELIKDEELPMEASTFQKDFLSLYSDREFKLNLKDSSYKKIGKMLEHMDSQGVIDYRQPKTHDHKIITNVNRKHSMFETFAPKYSLLKAKKVIEQS